MWKNLDLVRYNSSITKTILKTLTLFNVCRLF